jgi:undecaprenyl-diphosphatase
MKMKTTPYRYRLFIAVTIFFFGLVLFYGFSRMVRLGVLNSIDLAFTVKLQDAIDKTTHLRMAVIIGDILEGLVVLASPVISLLLLTILTIMASVKRHKPQMFWKGLFFPVAFLGLTVIEVFGKLKVEHPSPPYFLLKNPTAHFPAHYVVEAYSYPSGHAARSFLLALFLLFLILKKIPQPFLQSIRSRRFLLAAVLVFIYPLLVSLSVIYLGHHWLTDIAGGWILALVLGLPAGFFYFL